MGKFLTCDISTICPNKIANDKENVADKEVHTYVVKTKGEWSALTFTKANTVVPTHTALTQEAVNFL
jgi:hypothetical protein